MVKRYGDLMVLCIKKHSAVKGAPVELPFEVLSEATFTGISMSRQRQEIHPSMEAVEHLANSPVHPVVVAMVAVGNLDAQFQNKTQAPFQNKDPSIEECPY